MELLTSRDLVNIDEEIVRSVFSKSTFVMILTKNTNSKPQNTAQDTLSYGYTTRKTRYWIIIELECRRCNFSRTGTITFFVTSCNSAHIQEYQSMAPFTCTWICGGYEEHS
jgi:hypothetical protein